MPPDESWLLIVGLNGPGNQVHALKQAMFLSRRLQRTLVLPVILPHHSTGDAVPAYPAEDVYDIDQSYCTHVPSSVARVLPPPSCIFMSQEHAKDAEDQNLWHRYHRDTLIAASEAQGISELATLPVRPLSTDVEAFATATHGMRVVCLCIFKLVALPAPDKALICRSIGFSHEAVRSAAEAFVSKQFGTRPFVALNLRRVLDLSTEEPTALSFRDVFRFDPSELERHLRRLCARAGRRPMRVFLAAPPMYHGVHGMERIAAACVPEPVSDEPAVNAVVVQCICCMAHTFVYVDAESTFTQFILDYRQHRGAAGSSKCVLTPAPPQAIGRYRWLQDSKYRRLRRA